MLSSDCIFFGITDQVKLKIKAKEFASEKHTDANIQKILCVQDVWAPRVYFGTLLMHLCGGS